MKITAVIMAGGKGERFWPKSRSKMPKQFLSLTPDGITMIQHTVNRIKSMVNIENIFIVTSKNYQSLVYEQLPELPKENVLAEPAARNTAPCIALAAAVINQKYSDAIMMVLPADHLIKNNEMFLDTLRDAAQIASEDDKLVTIGITPTYPEVGYGYINFTSDGEVGKNDGAYRVERFVEKPDMVTAKKYLTSGKYLWNSGMFVWRITTILDNFKRFLPAMYEGAMQIKATVGMSSFEMTLKAEYDNFESISIDYGIMEKAANIFTIPGNFGWDDVGSWLALERFNPTNDDGNVIEGDIITIDTKDSIIIGGKRLIVGLGLEDLVVVDTDDAILICNKDNTQNIKKVIENLRICNRNELI